MKKIVVLDEPLVSMWIYPERKMIHHVQKAYCYGADFRNFLTKGTEALRLHKATRWLSDDRSGGAIPQDDEEWASKIWFPQTKAAGWKHWAIVPPRKVIGHIKIERIGKAYSELGINTRLFDDPDEAMKWLEAQ